MPYSPLNPQSLAQDLNNGISSVSIFKWINECGWILWKCVHSVVWFLGLNHCAKWLQYSGLTCRWLVQPLASGGWCLEDIPQNDQESVCLAPQRGLMPGNHNPEGQLGWPCKSSRVHSLLTTALTLTLVFDSTLGIVHCDSRKPLWLDSVT